MRTDEILKRLYQGIGKFQRLYFEKEQESFRRLSEGQSPDILFITCVDSRVDPNLLTQSMPGVLLTLRTPGNIIPPSGAIEDADSSAATIEFAVMKLKVRHIIVCGHSGCGVMQALYSGDEGLKDATHLKGWVELAAPVREMIGENYSQITTEVRQRNTEEKNVLQQLNNIRTYPFVNHSIREGSLHLHGWYYDIAKGAVYVYNYSTERFERIGIK